MDNCDNSDFKRALVRTEVHKMLEVGFLQYALTNCEGIRLGQGAEVMLCCPGCKDTPPSGPDNDTTNKSMGWDIPTQEVSVTDSANGKVSAIINFNKADAPVAKPITGGPYRFYGKDKELALSGPAAWLTVILEDGTAYKVPAYSDDIPVNCEPLVDFREEDGTPLSYVRFGVSAVARLGETFQDFLNRSIDFSQINWNTVVGSDNTGDWKAAGRKIVDALGIDDTEAGNYVVRLAKRGWVNLGSILNFQGGVIVYKQAYGYTPGGSGLAPIYNSPSLGLDAQGVPMLTLVPGCGFQNVQPGQDLLVYYVADDNGAYKRVVRDSFYYGNNPSSIIQDLAIDVKDFKDNHMAPSETLVYIKTSLGVLDFPEAFPSGEIITLEDSGAPTSLNTQKTVYFYSDVQYDGNTATVNKSDKTGWILDNDTTSSSPPGTTLHYVRTRIDPDYVSGSYDSQKAMLLVD